MIQRPRVRPARPDDALGLALVQSASWRAAYPSLLPAAYLASLERAPLRRRWEAKLAAGGRGGDTLVLELGEVIGYCETGPCLDEPGLIGFAGEVFTLYLHPTWWGRGWGDLLLARALELLAQRGLFWVVIWVLADNARALRFYARHGFGLDGAARVDTLGGGEQRVVRTARSLNPVPLRGPAETGADR